MSASADDTALLLRQLRALLGDDAVVAGEGSDERVARHVSGRSIGRPLAWIRAGTPEAVAEAVRVVGTAGRTLCAVGSATTFWDGLRVEGAVVLDALALRLPLRIDADARIAHVGAGWSIREIDQAAREVGLTIASRPDAAGDTPIGSLLSVASTAGLGMGYGAAVDQIVGATAVTGQAQIVRFGTSHALHGRPFCPHGWPNALGLLAAAEGRAAIVTDVGVRLRRTPHVAQTRCARLQVAPTVGDVLPLLGIGRDALDAGVVDTFRIEFGLEGSATQGRLEAFARTYSDAGPAPAVAAAHALESALVARQLSASGVVAESTGAHRGRDPDYAMHWAFPVAEHRTRLLDCGFWGAEITVPWGPDLAEAITCARELFESLAAASPRHRRLAIYPGPHGVSLGVQTLVPRAESSVSRARDIVRAATRELIRFGVPYRRGFLWREAIDQLTDPIAVASLALGTQFLDALDPLGVIGPRSEPIAQRGRST